MFVTHHAGILGPVTDLRVETSSESVQLKWGKPYSLYGVSIFGFDVLLTENGTSKVISDNFYDNSTTLIEVGPSLTACQAYQVKVWANNGAGIGNEASLMWFNPGGMWQLQHMHSSSTKLASCMLKVKLCKLMASALATLTCML